MAVVGGAIGPYGPILRAKIGPAAPQRRAMERAGLRPQVLEFEALVDTGAARSVVDEILVAILGLVASDTVMTYGAAAGREGTERDVCGARIVLGGGEGASFELPVVVVPGIAERGYFIVVGRDVLDRCVLTYNGPAGMFRLEF